MGKLNFILILFLFTYSLFFLQSNLQAKEDSLFIKITGDTVQVWNTDITANCASRFSLNMMSSGIDSFTVIETDTVGPLANCTCNYDLYALLTGLEAGEYTISVYRQELKKYLYQEDTAFFIGKLSFTLQDSSAAEKFFSYKQSNCKPYFDEQTFTARYFFAEADSAAKTLSNDAKIQTIYSDDVFLDGKSSLWTYKFLRYNQNNNRPEYLYFHNNTSGIVFDSTSLYTVCCVTNISDKWFDSDSAVAYADDQGGKAFRDDNPDYTIKASLVQALVPDSYPSWSITYLSKTDSSKKFSLFFDARLNMSVQVSFIPEVDTLYLQGGCCQPGISFHAAPAEATENMSIIPDFNTTFITKNASGNYETVDTSYFLVTHPVGNYEYELWYYSISIPRSGPVLITLDSVFHTPWDFVVKLVVKQNGIHVDSLSQFFVPQYGLDVKSDDILPSKYYLFQNQPNPFNPSTTIKYELPEETSVNVIIYNIIGQKVAELVNSFQKAGRHEIVWDAQNIASGIYFCRMRAGNFVSTKKLVLLK